MDYRNQTPSWSASESQASTHDQGLRAYMLGIYNYMASALALTGLTAYAGANVPAVRDALYVVHGSHLGLSGLGWLVAFAPLIMCFMIGAAINRLSLPAAQAFFWAFAGVMGLSLSSLFFAYTSHSIVQVFLVTAIMFGVVGMMGYSAKRDLTSMAHFMFMGFIGIFVAALINVFLGSPAIQFVISVVGVVVFTGFIAYDTQKLKNMYYMTSGNSEMAARSSIFGALQLYIDFINLFVSLLRLMGDRR